MSDHAAWAMLAFLQIMLAHMATVIAHNRGARARRLMDHAAAQRWLRRERARLDKAQQLLDRRRML